MVIGASGQVGSVLARVLGRSGFEVVPCYQSRPIKGAIKLDVRDKDTVARCLESTEPSVVFLAVNTPGGVDACESHPQEARALNLVGTQNVAEAAAQCLARIVYYSTDYIFDGKAGPYSEDDEPRPINDYGKFKWEAEEVIRASHPDHLILRTTAVFGWDRASRNFAMQLWERLQEGKPVPVPSDQWCNPTLADYLVEASVRLVQMDAKGIYNVVGKDRMPRSDLARALARTMAFDPALILPVLTSEIGQRARRPLEGGLKTEKLERVLGTEPLRLTESLDRFRRQWRADTHIRTTTQTVSTEAEQIKQQILAKVKEYHALVHTPREFVPFKTRVPYAGRVFGETEMFNLVNSALDFWLTLGPYGELFEHKMKKLLDAKDFVLVNSGSTANLTAVLTLMSRQLERPLKPGDEVITPAVTFPTTLAPIVHSGLVPVFVDCEVGTYNINPRLVEDAISDKTRAILIPHTLGNPCDMDILVELARRHSLYLIEDSCDALGSTFRGRLVGTFGDLATISFYPAHHITMGEGGGVVVNNTRLSRIVRSVRDWGRDCWCAAGESNTCSKRFGWQLGQLPHGYDHKYTYSNIGYNFKPTDMQAAIGVAQVDRISDFVEKRRRNFRHLYHGMESLQDYLILPSMDPRSNPSWFAFPLAVKAGVSRQKLVYWLENAGIETREIFAGNILRQPGYQDITCRIYGTLEESDRIMRDAFFVGVYPGLTSQMIDFMIERTQQFFGNAHLHTGAL
jgi:CDP-4-dehydro-6-deoxyglucose reductase, E1